MLDIRVIELVEFSAAVIIFADSGVARFTQLICDRRFCHFGAAQGRHVITASPLQLGKFLGQSVLRIVSPH